MLELENLSLTASVGEAEQRLLAEISLSLPRRHLCAVVGPSGCGKSTLLKTIAGISPPTDGRILWEGRDLDEEDLAPNEIGYVPQFSIAYDRETVQETLETSLRLRVGDLSLAALQERTNAILSDVGLEEIAGRRVQVLSGGQKRRLALGLEMASSPVLLLCDEVTSGLDAQAEEEVMGVLWQLAHPLSGHPAEEQAPTVLSVTHSLRHLAEHDSVVVLYQGRLVYHGEPAMLTHYFDLENAEQLFTRLAARDAEEWHGSWQKHSHAYAPRHEPPQETDASSSPENEVEKGSRNGFRAPSRLQQFSTLLARKWRLFLRDGGQLALHLGLLFGFPCLVVIFAWDGLPQIQNLTSGGDAMQQLLESVAVALRSSRVAGLVSGLVMFQVVLLTLVGSNNASREIAGERTIFEKEKFAGLHVSSYVASKAIFLAGLVAVQSIWMAVFVGTICRFPGNQGAQVLTLLLVNAAMTGACLGISSIAKSAEQASLFGVYLVGFQLPLSGAVLALPKVIGAITQPFIASYWGWSGYLQSMRETRFYDVVREVSQTELAAFALCSWVLVLHVFGGLLVTYLGCKHSRWE